MKLNEPINSAVSSRSSLLSAIPNLLSIARLLMGIAFPWTPAAWRIGWVIAAALTDLLDGASSRHFHTTSTMGRILDPVADKVFVLGVLAALTVEGQIELWQLGLVAFRDVAVLAGSTAVAVLKGWSELRSMPPTLLGKVTTAAQFAYFATLFFDRERAALVFAPTAAFSVVAGIDYFRRYLWHRPLSCQS